MMNVNYPIIDADGQCWKKTRAARLSRRQIFERASFRNLFLFPSLDGWNRGTGVREKIRKLPRRAGCNFSTSSRSHHGALPNRDWDSAGAKSRVGVRARARVQLVLAERFSRCQPAKGVALLPVHEPIEAQKSLSARSPWMSPVAAAVTALHKATATRFRSDLKPPSASICHSLSTARRARHGF